jgi:hypothetical protein
MKIILKSGQEYFVDEWQGRKPNSIRYRPVSDRDRSTHDTVEVHEVDDKGVLTGRKFEREISGIHFWQGMVIISWKHAEGDDAK